MEKRNRTERIVLIALFSTLTWIGAYLRIDFIPPIPFTLQTLMVVMAGLILGPRDAPLSQGVYLLLGLSGVPVFTQGGGPGYILRPTFGFFFGLSWRRPLSVGWWSPGQPSFEMPRHCPGRNGGNLSGAHPLPLPA